MKIRILVPVIILIAIASCYADNQKFIDDMESALHIHDTTQSVAGEIVALERFKEVCRKYPEEWLPNYWTAYLLTQVARLKGMVENYPDNLDPKALIRESQQYLDTADKLLVNKTDVQKSDLHVLQGFIYSWFRNIVAETDDEKKRYTDLQKAESVKAAKLNHQNPLLYVLIGINLTNDQEDYRQVLAGIALLNYADEIYSRESKRSMTTYWNKDFIPFWKGRAEQNLAKLLKKGVSGE